MALAAGKAGGKQRLSQMWNARHLLRLAIQIGAFSAFGSIELIPHGIIDHSRYQRSVLIRQHPRSALFEAHRNAELRKPVREVGGAVQRVHVPAELPLHAIPCAFFAVNSMLGKRLAEPLPDQLFYRRSEE